MEYFTSAQLAALLAGSLSTAAIVADASAPKGVAFKNTAEGGGCAAGHAVHWLHIENQEASVREDVAKIASHELVAVRCKNHRGARALAPPPQHTIVPPPPTHTHSLSLHTRAARNPCARVHLRREDGQDQPRGVRGDARVKPGRFVCPFARSCN